MALLDILDIAMVVTAILLLLTGYPVAFTLAGTAVLFYLLGQLAGAEGLLANLPARIVGSVLLSETLIAVPLFVYMGVVMERSGIADDLLRALTRLVRRLRGGLPLAVVCVGGLLAASTGIVGATVTMLGLIALPAMLRAGTDPKLACGTICAAGTLGQIVPPSIVLVILGDQISAAYQDAQAQLQQKAWAAGESFTPGAVSVGDLFAAALLPGLVLILFYGLYVSVMGRRGSADAASLSPLGEEERDFPFRDVAALLSPLALIALVLGSILAGIAPPSEAAGLGAAGALLLAGMRRLSGLDASGPDDSGTGDCVDTDRTTISDRIGVAVAFGLAAAIPAAAFTVGTTWLGPVSALAGAIGACVGAVLTFRTAVPRRVGAGLMGRLTVAVGTGCLAAALLLALLWPPGADMPMRDWIGGLLSGGALMGLLAALGRLHAHGILGAINRKTVEIAVIVFTIVIAASAFSLVFRGLGGDQAVRAILTDLPGGTDTALLAVLVAIFVLGFFLDFVEITLIVVPIVAPILLLDPTVSPVWLGVLIALVLQTSFLTPPLGYALFYLRGVAPAQVGTTQIYQGALPFVGLQVAALVTVWMMPGLAEWLPEVLFDSRF